VTNLPQSAFQVFENGVQQQIKIFKREDVPVSLGLIIDNSGSMREKRQSVESAAVALVKDSNPQDEVFVINFNDEVYLDADFTNDVSKMEQGRPRSTRAAARPCATPSACRPSISRESQARQEGDTRRDRPATTMRACQIRRTGQACEQTTC